MKKIVFPVLLLMLMLSACNTPPPPADTPVPVEEATPEATSEAPPPSTDVRPPLTIEDDKLYVAIIWHQHQPVYFKDPETGIYARPWVRVHAAKDYVDMAAMLQEYPDIHATFNLTPSLIRQLDDIGAGAKDLYWVHAEIPADELTDGQKKFILDRFFDINPRIIDRFPRYQQLAGQRDKGIEAWSEQDFRDLQVLFNLAWTDPDWLAQEPLAALVEKGRDFSEEDKAIIFGEHLRLVQEVIPLHAAMQESGQIEVTMTPFAHPILPLLVDSNLAKVALPDADLPDRFIYGQDAVAQVEQGVLFYEEHFGISPRGMWPAEGSVAEQVVSMISNAGIQWIATDEEVLASSLPDLEAFTRNSAETVQQADALYRPYAVQGTRGEPVAVIFRDHVISDKVGFTYSGTPGSVAASDFISRLENIKAQLDAEGATGPHLVTVLLDGENAWEYYDNDGKAFLNELYRQLSESEDIVTVTPSEYLAALEQADEPLREIEDLYPGSWIDGTFSTWIGEDEENLAWEYLKQTRDDVQEAITGGKLDDATLDEVMTLMYIAEGSDWFWWYGADQNSGNDGDFDIQFRAYLKQIYELIGMDVPAFVYVPIISQTAQQPDQYPQDLLAVTIDGQPGENEWENAGLYLLDGEFSRLYYGFDQENLYLRIDAESGFTTGETYGFYFGLPGAGATNAYSRYGEGKTLPGFGVNVLVEVTTSDSGIEAAMYTANGAGGWRKVSDVTGIRLDQILELVIPFEDFPTALNSGDNLNTRLIVSEGGEDIALYPVAGPALATVPDLPVPNVFAEFTDPKGDDYGPGSYTYPDDNVFRAGTYDLLGLTIGEDEENYIFRVQFSGAVDNSWGAPNGMGTLAFDIYIDVDGAANGDRMLLPGRNAALTEEFAWDAAIWAEGWTPGIYVPGSEGPTQVKGEFTILTNPGQKRVTLLVPKSMLPEGDPTTWLYTVAVISQEGYPSAGVWRARDVLPKSEQWRLGGGTGSTNDTRIMDILLPEDSEYDQESLLTNPNPSTAPVDELLIEDFPKIILLSPG